MQYSKQKLPKDDGTPRRKAGGTTDSGRRSRSSTESGGKQTRRSASNCPSNLINGIERELGGTGNGETAEQSFDQSDSSKTTTPWQHQLADKAPSGPATILDLGGKNTASPLKEDKNPAVLFAVASKSSSRKLPAGVFSSPAAVSSSGTEMSGINAGEHASLDLDRKPERISTSKSRSSGIREAKDSSPGLVSGRSVLVAGATGYLGRYVVKELARQNHVAISLCRESSNYSDLQSVSEIRWGDVTDEASLSGKLANAEVVISCLSNAQLENPFPVARDGTIKLFQEAARAGVKHFVIVSVFNGAQLRHSVEAARAKEQACDFVAEHAPSHGMRWTIVRPTGFFKDMDEMFRRTAATGKFLIVGDGKARLNPISGADLAERIALCISQRSDWNASVDVGGPEVFSLEQIGEMTFEALGRPTKFDRIPGFLLGAAASIFVPLQCCDPKMQQYADFARFASYVCTKDNVAPAFGRRRLAPHFARLAAVLKSDPELLDD